MVARDLLKRGRAWLRADRTRVALVVGAALLWAAGTISFVAGQGARGPTARLTADAYYYHAYLPSLAFDRDLDFTDEYRVTQNWYRFGKTALGRPANVFGIGPAVFEAPMFAAGHLVARAGEWKADGFSRPEVVLSLYASLLASFGALVIAYRLVRRRLAGRARLACAVTAVALASPVVYYAIRQPGYAHPFATLFVAWLVERIDASFDGGKSPRGFGAWIGFGALLGAATLARPQLALWAVALLPAVVDDVRRALAEVGGRWRAALTRVAPRWAAGAAVALAVFAPQLLAWRAIYGELYLVPQGPGFMRWDEPAVSETLFSSRNGLFAYAPLLALACIGLVAALRRHGRLAGTLLAGFALQTVANGAVWDWWAGGSFGGRRFDSCFIAFAFGFAFLIAPRAPGAEAALVSRGRRVTGGVARAVAWILAALLVAGNLAWAGHHSAETVRIHGGEPAPRVLAREIPRPLGAAVGWISSLATIPARLAFAARLHASPAAYDVVVGTHVLGELYPRLNSIQDKRRQTISLAPDPLRNRGVARPGAEQRRSGAGAIRAVMTRSRARLLVGFNRRGPVRFELRLQRGPHAASDARVRLIVNGERLADAEMKDSPMIVEGRAASVPRGTSEVVIEAPPGTLLQSLTASSPVQADGRP
jgi:hypothetical protein